jgi:hypothetical protein
MNSENLSRIWGPNLLRSEENDFEELLANPSLKPAIVRFMINNHHEIFGSSGE